MSWLYEQLLCYQDEVIYILAVSKLSLFWKLYNAYTR